MGELSEYLSKEVIKFTSKLQTPFTNIKCQRNTNLNYNMAGLISLRISDLTKQK